MHSSLACEIFDALPVAAIVHDRDTILVANAAMQRLFSATSRDQLEGHPIADIAHPDGRDAGAERRRLMLENGQRFSNIPVQMRALTGESVHATVSAVPYAVGDTPLVVAAACRAAECVADHDGASSTALSFPIGTPLAEAAVDAFPQPVVAIGNRIIAYANHAAVKLLRAEGPADVVGRPVFDIIHRDALRSVAEQLLLILSRRVSLTDAPVKARALDGTPILARGNSGHVRLDGTEYALFVATSVNEG